MKALDARPQTRCAATLLSAAVVGALLLNSLGGASGSMAGELHRTAPPGASAAHVLAGVDRRTSLAGFGQPANQTAEPLSSPQSPAIERSATSSPYVTQTLVLFNRTVTSGNFRAGNGISPRGIAYDSGKRETYVADYSSNTVSVIADSTNSVVTTIGVGGGPVALTYDSGLGEIFIANNASGNVSVLSDVNHSVIASISVGLNPTALAYAEAFNEVFVANTGSDDISVIKDSTNSVLTTVEVGCAPDGVAYDNRTNQVFVANYATGCNGNVTGRPTFPVSQRPPQHPGPEASTAGGLSNSVQGTVSVIGSTLAVVATIPVGYSPVGLACDNGTGMVYVANSGSGNLSVISDATDQVVATISVLNAPWAVAYDNATMAICVTNAGSDKVSLINDGTNRVFRTVAVGTSPRGISFNFGQRRLVVSNEGSNNLSIINDTSNAPARSISVGSVPDGLAWSDAVGVLFVADRANDNLSAFATPSMTFAAAMTVGFSPAGVAFDSRTGELFVANSGDASVSVLVASTHKLKATIPTQMGPVGIAYDSARGEVFVAESSTNNVSVIADATDRVVAEIPVGNLPDAVAYDKPTGQVFVANAGSNSVSIISDTTNQVTATVSVGSYPDSLACDNRTGEVYVTDSQGNSVSVISTSTDRVVATIPVGTHPEGATYDSRNGEVFIANAWSDNVSAILESTHRVVATVSVGAGPCASVYDWTDNRIYTANLDQGTLSTIIPGVPPPVFKVTFTEVGLPPGASWTVAIAGSTRSSTSNALSFSETNGTYAFAVEHVTGYSPFPASSTLVVNGSSISVTIGFSFDGYAVYFLETGLPHGTAWSITLDGSAQTSSSSTVSFIGKNGTHVYSVGSVSGWITSNSGGVITVHGTGVTRSISWSQVTYAVTFAETGLPAGTNWAASLAGVIRSSTTSLIGFVDPNGSYPFTVVLPGGYDPLPSSGMVTVAGADAATTILFKEIPIPPCTLWFAESGLLSGTPWTVIFNGVAETGLGNLPFSNIKAGTYPFTVGAVEGFLPKPPSGTLSANGVDLVTTIGFDPTYAVRFLENGLPPGASWSVSLNGTSQGSTTASVTFAEPNGTYAFSIHPITGYSPNIYSGTLTVAGGNSAKVIVFSTSHGATPAPGQTLWGPPGVAGYTLLGGILATIVVAAMIGVIWTRRRKTPTGPPLHEERHK